LGNNNLLFLKV